MTGLLKRFNCLTSKLTESVVPPTSVLQGKRGYLSGPIENDATNFNWRVEPLRVLRDEFKINMFDPHADPKQQWVPILREARDKRDYGKIAHIARDFVRKDLAMVDRSDLLIAYLPRNVYTTGTHHEVINSDSAKKPTLLICPEGKEHIPIWYHGFIPHEFMFGSWESLYEYLREVNECKHTENRRWHFVYGLI